MTQTSIDLETLKQALKEALSEALRAERELLHEVLGYQVLKGSMSQMLKRVLALVRSGEVRVSDHGYDELAADLIFVEDVIAGASGASD